MNSMAFVHVNKNPSLSQRESQTNKADGGFALTETETDKMATLDLVL